MKEALRYTQETTYSCGAASLLIAYHMLGIDYNEPTLMHEVGTTPDQGTQMEVMFNHAASLGFPVELKCNASYRDLKKDHKRGAVVIAMNPYWNGEPGGHYVVLEDLDDEIVSLADPGLTKENWPNMMSKDEFISKWNCPGYPASYLLIRPKS